MLEYEIEDEEMLVLKNVFYDRLRASLNEDNKLKGKSLILRLFSATPNHVLPNIIDSSISFGKVEKSILLSLQEKNLIKNSYKPNEYMITPKGIWEIETHLKFIDIDHILEYLDNKFFFVDESSLFPKEKVVILTLIAIRAFYEKCPLNRKNGEPSQEKLYEILTKSKKFLINMGKIEDFKLGYSKENQLESVFRRMDKLKKKTGNLYEFNRDGKIWLSLYDENTNGIVENDLSYLFWKIFGGDLDYKQQKQITDFCDEILREYKNYIFNDEEFENHIFSRADFENTISNSLFLILSLKDGWSSG